MPDKNNCFSAGDEIYRRSNPGRRGIITDKPPIERGSALRFQIKFHDGGTERIPEYELERAKYIDPETLIEKRQFGKASDLRRNLSHIQLSGKLSNLIYSLDVTNTDFLPHQFKPVLAFLESPTRGLLIADEVGLGKTIEAGLIWTELRARYDCRRLLIVCPAMLREKWRDEMRDRFGIDAVIMDANQLLDELNRPSNQISDGKGIICSIQGIRPPSQKQQNENPHGQRQQLAALLDRKTDEAPMIDLTIIDEAHYMRNRSNQSARLGRILRDISKNTVLLSATPINLRSEDLFNLLNLVDQDTFGESHFFSQIVEANAPLIRAREFALDNYKKILDVQHCLDEAAAHKILRDNEQLKQIRKEIREKDSVTDNATRVRLADQIERVNLLQNAVNRTRKIEVIELRVQREPETLFVPFDGGRKDGVERTFYDDVTAAVHQYADKKGISGAFLLSSPQRQMSSSLYAAAKSWADRTARNDKKMHARMRYEDGGDMEIDSDDIPDPAPLMEHLAHTVLPHVDIEQLQAGDSKFTEFHVHIKKYCQDHPDEKIVVFSYFRQTLLYLQRRLTEENIACQVLMGGMQESKQTAIARFRDDSSTKVLLSSEVASEGVDLQFCRVVVNYDLPWNPMKIEQRIGRLDRIGQKSEKISIWNLGYKGTIDHQIYDRLFLRLKIFERALGGLEAILGKEVTKITDSFFSKTLTSEQREKQLKDTCIAVEKNRSEIEKLEEKASSLLAHGDYVLQKIKAAHETKMGITEHDLMIYVRDYLNEHAPNHEFHQLQSDKLIFDIRLPPQTAAKLEDYIERKKMTTTQLARGSRVRCEFRNKAVVAISKAEQISQFHSLVRFINAKVDEDSFYPVIAVRLPNHMQHTDLQLQKGQYAFTVRKWSFNGLREEENLQMRVTHTETGQTLLENETWKLINAVRLHGKDWPEAANLVNSNLVDKIDICDEELQKHFMETTINKETENRDHVALQIHSAKQHRNRKLTSKQQILDNYKVRNQSKMIPAIQGQIDKTKERFEVQIARLKDKASMQCDERKICCGVLLIE